jgi:hypothetical protein
VYTACIFENYRQFKALTLIASGTVQLPKGAPGASVKLAHGTGDCVSCGP